MGKKIIFLVLFAVVVFFIFFIENLLSLDPDFGWHLRMGEIIIKNGIPKTDPFSYTMPSFPFVDHEWLSNVLIHFIYKKSFFLLAIVFALFPLFALLITFYKSFKFYLFGIYVLSFSILLYFSGIRVQVISWAFSAILLLIVLNGDLWKKFRLLIPFLVILWANLHGGFSIAIYILALTIVAKIIERKIEKLDIAVFVASIFATFLNPYGARLWGEIFLQIGDPTLRWRIAEWLPAVFFIKFSFLLLLAVSLALFLEFKRKVRILDTSIFLGLFLLSFLSVRHMPFFIIANLIIAPKLFSFLLPELKGKLKKDRFNKVALVFAVLSLVIFSFEYINGSERIFSHDNYPAKAVFYLKKQKIEGQVFSGYDWGGYLIWKMPEKKVFIDGRMPSWRWEAPKNESNYAFLDYSKIISGEKDHKAYFEKYNITFVLYKKPFRNRSIVLNLFRFFKKEKRLNLAERLEKDSWEKVYEDGIAVIYRK